LDLRVEYFYDAESQNWCFVVPSLKIIGDADSREDAERRAIEAIEYALWSDAQEPTPEGGEIGYLTVTIEHPTTAGRRAG
jgi:hypothetical protein